MNEEMVIKKEGFTISKEVSEKIDKSERNTIKQLTKMGEQKEITVLCFDYKNFKRRVYLDNELFNFIRDH